MEQTFTFRDAGGQKFRATINIKDLHAAAFSLARRARHEGRNKVKALDGGIELTLEAI